MNGAETKNVGELQLYKVLQRANLLCYYDTFISQGGDDVQQLCEAGEEEFLEIVSLVGMASKPLHVRRFQKALQEWVTAPHLFQPKPKDLLSNASLIHVPTTRRPPTNGQTFLSELYQQPSPLPNVSHKGRNILELEKSTRKLSSPNNNSEDVLLPNFEDDVSSSLDEKTIQFISKFAVKEAEERFSRRYTFEQAAEHIKKTKRHPHVVRVLEMKSGDARNKEMRRISALFPVHLNANILSKSPLSLFELMCNEAANQLCLIHPVLAVADRAERLEAAQAVVRKVEKEIQQSQRGLLDLTSNDKFRGKADEILAKIEEIKEKQEAYKQKIAAAEASKNVVHLSEYQSDLSRLKQDEQVLLRQKGKILTQHGGLSSDLLRKNRKSNELKVDVKSEKDEFHKTEHPEAEINVLQSSALAELARAHNVFDYSNDDVPNEVAIKREMIDDAIQDLSSSNPTKTTVKRSNSNSEDVLSLIKKSKPNT